MTVLSHVQVRPMLAAWGSGQLAAIISLDLGLSTAKVSLRPGGVGLPNGKQLSWTSVEAIAANETACFVIRDGEPSKIQFFSERLNRVYTLMPTVRAPTMLISGIPMHRIKDIDPYQDTLQKIKTVAPLTGLVLDTATGLGYTAIEAARTAGHVITIELDPTVLEVCRLNPWSRDLFDNPRIEQRIADAFDEVTTFADETFSRVIHDPPTFSLAGDLYSGEFYRHLHRVLKRGGRLFHYVGDLNSKSGRSVSGGVVRRLRQAGFRRVVKKSRAYGIVAYR